MSIKGSEGLSSLNTPVTSSSLNASGLIPCIAVVYPREMAQCFKLVTEPRTLGSGQNADIALHDDEIAAVHCRLSVVGKDVLVEDLGSSGGTWIDAQRIDKAVLEQGSLLQVGHYRFMLSQRQTLPREARSPRFQVPGTDEVTGIPNRSWILRRAEYMLDARSDSPRPVSLALLAVDHLDRVQREFGYETSDRLMVEVTRLLDGRLRDKEALGMFGSEKLILLMPEMDAGGTSERLLSHCGRLRSERFSVAGSDYPVTLSVGFATRQGNQIDNLDGFLALADRALYQARQQGGDRVIHLG